MPTTLGASHLATDSWEIQRTNNFEVSFSGLDTKIGAGTNRIITLAVESGFLPAETSNVENLNFGNTLVKVAGTTTYNNGTLVVKDDIVQDVENIIREWRKLVYNPITDAVGLASNYKIDGRVIQYAPDGTMERTWVLKGVWPSAVDYGQLDYTSQGGKKTISITLEYDKAISLADDPGNGVE